MTDIVHTGLTQVRYPLSAAECPLEETILAELAGHFPSFPGTPREAYAAMSEWTPIAEGIVSDPVEEESISGWWVRPEGAPVERAILFLHGGVYMLGSADCYRGLASQLAVRAGIATFILDYPLAPEHPFPAAPDAAAAALRWLATRGVAEVALVGDSAGGALALAALAQHDNGAPRVASVTMFSPWLDLAFTGPSFTSPDTHDPVLNRHLLESAAVTYLAGADATDRRASPLYDISQALPPILIQVGEDELLLDDARRYAEAAAAAGGAVRLEMFEGLHHVFQRSVTTLPSARRALDDAAAFVQSHWR